MAEAKNCVVGSDKTTPDLEEFAPILRLILKLVKSVHRLVFQEDLLSATSMESSRRALSFDVTFDRFSLKLTSLLLVSNQK